MASLFNPSFRCLYGERFAERLTCTLLQILEASPAPVDLPRYLIRCLWIYLMQPVESREPRRYVFDLLFLLGGDVAFAAATATLNVSVGVEWHFQEEQQLEATLDMTQHVGF